MRSSELWSYRFDTCALQFLHSGVFFGAFSQNSSACTRRPQKDGKARSMPAGATRCASSSTAFIVEIRVRTTRLCAMHRVYVAFDAPGK